MSEEWLDANRQLPDGYRRRIEIEILNVQRSAGKILDIIEEFNCSSIILNDGDVFVEIKRRSE